MGQVNSFPGLSAIPLEATHLRGQQWCVKPVGQLGTCGFSPVPWTAQFVRAKSAEEALRRAKPVLAIYNAGTDAGAIEPRRS